MIELAAAIAAVKAVSGLVRESVDLVQSIQSGWRAKNDEAQQKLRDRLAQLEQSLSHTGELAWVAAAYARMLESTLELLQSCTRAQLFFRENIDSLSRRAHDEYDADWRLAQVLFDGVDENRAMPRKALLDRVDWYDEKDRAQIDLLLNGFDEAYSQATAFVQTKAAREVQPQLDRMVASLKSVRDALQTTMYDQVLQTLQQLKA